MDDFGAKHVAIIAILVLALLGGLAAGIPAYSRYQARQDANNQIILNEFQIRQTEQLVKVEQQKAQIRVVDAEGIAQAQKIINATLTPLYIQHEAIQAQEKMINSPNHTEVYIPSGFNGVPLVKTLEDK